MPKLTPFGVALRKLRVERELRLFDLAEKLGRSTAMLSAIETGRKQIPDGFIAELVRALNLTSAEHKELRAAKDRTQKVVNVEHLAPDNREVVAAFARNPGELPSHLLEQIRKLVLRSNDDEMPFKRKRRGMRVPPLSRAKIETFAANVRNRFGCTDLHWFPIVEVIEFWMIALVPDFVFEVWGREVMGEDEGRVVPPYNTLILREDVYEKACKKDGRARFTAAHELAHFLMHHDVTFARASSDDEPIYCDAEWQADTFAGHLMIPRHLYRVGASAEETSIAFGTSAQAATVMISRYGS
jgi:transcriptional regulator with XRE-family HTH domain